MTRELRSSLIVGHVTHARDDVHASKFITIKMAGYTRFDLAGSYRLPVRVDLVESLRLFAKIENLFNKSYAEAHGFRARPVNFLIGLQGVMGKN